MVCCRQGPGSPAACSTLESAALSHMFGTSSRNFSSIFLYFIMSFLIVKLNRSAYRCLKQISLPPIKTLCPLTLFRSREKSFADLIFNIYDSCLQTFSRSRPFAEYLGPLLNTELSAIRMSCHPALLPPSLSLPNLISFPPFVVLSAIGMLVFRQRPLHLPQFCSCFTFF